MKLKKVVSLALAGVMAVGMLAGCSTGAGVTGNDNVTTTSSSIVDIVNNGQNANNKVKVTFTDSAALDAALEKAVALAGDAGTLTWTGTMDKLTGIKAVTVVDESTNAYNGYQNDQGFVKKLNATEAGYLKGEMGDATLTYVDVQQVYALSLDAAQKLVAQYVDDIIGKQVASTYADGMVKDNVYYDLSYNGNVALTSKTTSTGATVYYAAMVLNQVATAKTVA